MGIEAWVPRLRVENEEKAIERQKRSVPIALQLFARKRDRVGDRAALDRVGEEARDERFRCPEYGRLQVFRDLLCVLPALAFEVVDSQGAQRPLDEVLRVKELECYRERFRIGVRS